MSFALVCDESGREHRNKEGKRGKESTVLVSA
jgi:hypothetical protein